jgi:tetratricopeptide (TPR) repeat protein
LAEQKQDWPAAVELWRKAGDLERARAALEQTGDAMALATFFAQEGKLDEAAKRLEAKQGKPAKAVAILAPLAEQKQDWPAAVELWRKAGDLERALAALEQTGDAMALATFFAQEGKLDEAAKRLEAWAIIWKQPRCMRIRAIGAAPH